jgi:hypothetical protein
LGTDGELLYTGECGSSYVVGNDEGIPHMEGGVPSTVANKGGGDLSVGGGDTLRQSWRLLWGEGQAWPGHHKDFICIQLAHRPGHEGIPPTPASLLVNVNGDYSEHFNSPG